MFKRYTLISLLLSLATTMATGKEITIGTDPDHNILDLNNALGDAAAGDTIILKPGVYRLDNEISSLFAAELEDVVIRGEDPANPAVIDGNGIGKVFLLRRPKNLTLENLVIQNMTEGGLNIDDADIDTANLQSPGSQRYPAMLRYETLSSGILVPIVAISTVSSYPASTSFISIRLR